jgi:4-amino-4-deoxy-L-arabinose transferase-like glycosyltransferase
MNPTDTVQGRAVAGSRNRYSPGTPARSNLPGRQAHGKRFVAAVARAWPKHRIPYNFVVSMFTPAFATPNAPPSAPSARRVWRDVGLWVAGAFLLRSLLAALVPLLPDETYYWEWSRRLEGGYFDHPPGIALLIATGVRLFGNTVAGVRAGPALAALVTHGAAVLGAWQLGGRGAAGALAARRAAQLVALLPIATLGLVLATPDAVLFASAMLALVAVERALAAPPRSGPSLAWWTAAGVALGAAFVAKYTAVLLPMGLVTACLIHPGLRARFREPGPWIAGAIALAMFSPVVAWNAFNNWVSFRFQLGHGFSPSSRGTPLTRELEMIGGQAGLASPILFGLMAIVVWLALRDGWRVRRGSTPTDLVTRRFALAMIALVPLLFFAISAWRRAVEANWPAMIYPGAMVLLATSERPFTRGRWWRSGLAFAAVLLLVVTAQAWTPLLPLPPRRDPIARAHGWRDLAAAVDSARVDPFLDGTVDRFVVAERYQDASELAFHLQGQPTVFAFNLGGRSNQYDIWKTIWESVHPGDGLVAVFDADEKGDALAARVSGWFADTKQGPRVSLTRHGGEVTTRRLWLYRLARDMPRERPGSAP